MSLVHCTGSGTQEDPYIFNSWDGLMECTQEYFAYCQYDDTIPLEERVWDMNNIRPEGINYLYLTSSVRIDFKGLRILNLRFINGYYSNTYNAIVAPADSRTNQCTISNLYLLNCICSDKITCFAAASGGYLKFYNCVMSIFSLNGTTMHFVRNTSYAYYNKCSINFKLHTLSGYACGFASANGSIVTQDPMMNSCKVKLNISGPGYFNIINSYFVNITNVKFYGKSSAPTRLASSASGSYTTTTCVVYDLECTLDGGELITSSSYSAKDTVCGLLNSDKVTFTNVPSGTDIANTMLTKYNINLLTSAQMIDMDYLDNVGFPVLRAGT